MSGWDRVEVRFTLCLQVRSKKNGPQTLPAAGRPTARSEGEDAYANRRALQKTENKLRKS